jgi:cysteine desulfurase
MRRFSRQEPVDWYNFLFSTATLEARRSLRTIYLDNSATTPLDPRVAASMLPHLSGLSANPGSAHSAGRAASKELEESRAAVADLAGCDPAEVFFTSSATEANNLALKGVSRARGRRGTRLLISPLEHSSVLHPARTLAAEGMDLEELPVDAAGRVDLEALRGALREAPCLVSIQQGNPEIGTLQPLVEAASLASEAGAVFHTDASATAGLLPEVWKQAPIHLMTISPHLFHGPKGIAALVVRKGTRLKPQEEGGTQEGGLRAGTESVALAAGFGAAARLALLAAPSRADRLTRLADTVRRRLEEVLPDWTPTGHARERIPGHLSLCLRYVEGEAVLGLLDEEGILAGSGSPCSRHVMKESPVLKAIGIDPVLGRGSIRFSFSAFNRDQDAERLAAVLPGIVERLRRISPLVPGA